jgi:hypothetical protein
MQSVVRRIRTIGNFENVGGLAPFNPAPFNPTSLITGSGGFWRADMGVTLSGSNVTAWADQSSFANNLTVNDSTSPIYSSTGFNASFPGIDISQNTAAGLYLTGVNYSTTTFSIFMVGQYTSNASGREFSVGVGGTDILTPACTFNDPGAYTLSFYSSGVQAGPETIATANNVPAMIGVTGNGSIALPYNNFVSDPANEGTFSSTIGSASCVFVVGFDVHVSSTTAQKFIFAYVGITQKVMNSTDWANLKAWTNSNWGTLF